MSRVREMKDLKDELYIIQCAACRRFVCYSHRRGTSYCGDIFCLTAREWVWPLDELTAVVVHLVDKKGYPFTEVSKALGYKRTYIHGVYFNGVSRRVYARKVDKQSYAGK